MKKRKRSLQHVGTLPYLLMLVPGIVILLINNYLPMFGVIMAFQQYRFRDNFFASVLNSRWVGLENFRFLFANPHLWETLRNTVLYNFAFILLGMVVPVAVAIALNELRQRYAARFYQTVTFLPFFLSWIIISYLVFSLFTFDGAVNTMIMKPLGLDPGNWYMRPDIWPFLLIALHLWRFTGYNSIFYLAALSGINQEYYEAAMIDGAKKSQQIWYITIPHLKPIIIILSLLAVGRIFNSDFGLFYNIPMNRSTLFPATEVLDTFIYRSMMRSTADLGRPVAASLFQSLVGFITIISVNLIVRKVEPDSALF
jgi:putative aldouronate transport system permease protein